jgi:hypothetical protein
MVILLLLLGATAAMQPSPEALRLGRQLAESGTLATLLPMMKQSNMQELINNHPELSKDEQMKLRAAADRIYAADRERLMQVEARAYAQRMSIPDLRRVAKFQRSDSGKRYRAAIPGVIADTMQSIHGVDFKADVLAAYCKETGKLCAK